MEIIAIDDGDLTGFAECATSIGEVTMSSVQSMVDNVIGKLNGASIDLLHIQVHGDSTAVYFGDTDVLDLNSFQSTYRPVLTKLTPYFSLNDPWVHLRACEIGQNVALLQSLAGMWNATICAGRGYQNNLYDFNTGKYVTVRPDGTSEVSFLEPGQAMYRTLVMLINAF